MFDKRILRAFFRQQRDLSMPDIIFNSKIDVDTLFGTSESDSVKKPVLQSVTSVQARQNVNSVEPQAPSSVNKLEVPSTAKEKQSIASRLSGLRTIEQLGSTIKPRQARPVASVNSPVPSSGESRNQSDTSSSFDQKRAALRVLFYEGCTKCGLAKTRKNYVFGEGRADGPVMVIGDMPGADDDNQGLPFVGDAGQLLNNMLAAIGLDRKKNVFITNILKCRPPENKNPAESEISTCFPILKKQIEIIKPKALLLLGNVAAHTLLSTNEDVPALRTKTHQYNNIPSMVIYHPVTLLRNPEYKRPAWEDLQKFKQLLSDLGVYESAKI